jgi:putative membrane protein
MTAYTKQSPQFAALATIVALSALTACGTKKETPATNSDSTTPTASAMRPSPISDSSSGAMAPARPGDVVAPQAAATITLDDAGILALVMAVDRAEAEAGSLASTKGSNADVKAFGREMVTAHRKDLAEVQAIAKAANITPPSGAAASSIPALADLERANKETAQSLGAVSGHGFDRAYIDAQVAGHGKVLDILRVNAESLHIPAVKDHITAMLQVVSAHRDKALSVQQKLGTNSMQ